MDMIKKATDVHITFLRNIGASFKVIFSDGEVVVHDPNNLIDLHNSEVKFKRGDLRNPGVKHGEPTEYVMSFLKDVEPGQMISIPNKYHPETMRSVVCNYARRLWGEKSYMTSITKDKLSTTLLRVK